MNYGATLHASDFWMGLQDASAYAGVGFEDLVDAITYREVRASTTHPARPGDWMVRMSEVDLWTSARRRQDWGNGARATRHPAVPSS